MRKIDWNRLLNPIIEKRKGLFKAGMILMVGINEDDEVMGIRAESHSFNPINELSAQLLKIKNGQKKEQLSYIG